MEARSTLLTMKPVTSIQLVMSFIGIAVILSGCSLSASPAPSTAIPVNTASSLASVVTAPLPGTSSPVPTSTLPATQTPQSVVVAAVKGNVFIRRGPDFAYNAVSVLMDGQGEKALARDVLSKWVQIPIPGHPKETGWISIQTRFVAVNGNVADLPEATPTDWPVLASIRNCTYHQMEADPGGLAIPAVDNFPENTVSINPGIYTIYDVEVDGSPDIMQVEVKEGSYIEILDDGDGDHKKCANP